MLSVMKLLATLFITLFAFAALMAQLPNGQPVRGKLLPACGPFVRKDVSAEASVKAISGSDCDGGGIFQQKNGFKFTRTVTADIYQNGTKFYCSTWEATGCDFFGSPSLPECPSNTCSNLVNPP